VAGRDGERRGAEEPACWKASEGAPRRRPIGEGRVSANMGPRGLLVMVEEDSGDYPEE
jgi:hypothetical protein